MIILLLFILFLFINHHILYYISYKGMTRSSIIGFLLFISLLIQLVSGLLLSIYYSDWYFIAFNSVFNIVYNIKVGWIIRGLHIISSNYFMLFLLLHFIRGFHRLININNSNSISSYRIGYIILIVSLIISFIGYILNWGQMSFWGLTVIINVIKSIPLIGNSISIIIWPSYTTGINRLFTIHYLLGGILIVLVLLHIFNLHLLGSSDNNINNSISVLLPFHCYFVKDLLSIIYLFTILSLFNIIGEDLLSNTDNNIEANLFLTPHNILPEWYFLLFYCSLRCFPNKITGLLTIITLFILLINSE